MENETLHRRLYRSLYRIRRVEEEVARIYPSDKIKSPVHLSIGQEAISVGACEALNAGDAVFGTYRSHALYLAKGGNLKSMIAELYGKATGCCKGKGGSMHLLDVSANMMGTSAVVGTTIPHAVGYAYAQKYRKTNDIVAVFFGDGAIEEGVFAESINFAVLKKLPVIFICENNRYAIHTHQSKRQGNPNPVGIASALGAPAERIENNDVLRVFSRVSDIAASVRERKAGPHFLECMTYRWMEHVGPNEDYQLGYRSKEEQAQWLKEDQVTRLGAMIDQGWRNKTNAEVEAEIEEAFAFAENSPFPEASELYTDVFKGA